MSQRSLGFVLISAACVGLIGAFSGVDEFTARAMKVYGLVWALSTGQTFGGLPLGLISAALIAVGLVGAGLLIFGKRPTP